jgi:hypothetical protein
MSELVTRERVMELLDYDPETGAFRWKVGRRGTRVGDVAGTRHIQGYRLISIGRRNYLAHRLAWLIVHGAWPATSLDHANGHPDDNRIINLRPATRAENSWNTRTRKHSLIGLKGVGRKGTRFYARIKKHGKVINLGHFASAEEAHRAYCKAAAELHGEFFNPGSQRRIFQRNLL